MTEEDNKHQIMNITLSLNLILVQNHDENTYTAFFAQFPNIISEGDTSEDAIQGLMTLTQDVFRYQKEEQYNLIKEISEIEHYKQITNSFGESTVREVVYALIQSNEDLDLVFSLFEDAGMWRHAMCLNELVFKK